MVNRPKLIIQAALRSKWVRGISQGAIHLTRHHEGTGDAHGAQCIEAIRSFVPQVGIEVGPMETPEYRRMVDAGSEGLVVYQEPYHRETYNKLHTAGPKRNFDWRLECPERGYAGGFRRIKVVAAGGRLNARARSGYSSDGALLAPRMD